VVKWSQPAKNDLRQIYDFIARDSRFYAQKVTFEIVKKSEKLNSFPEAGRIVPEMGDNNIRELLIYSYRIIYEISPNKVEVLALIHAKRNFLNDLMSEHLHLLKSHCEQCRHSIILLSIVVCGASLLLFNIVIITRFISACQQYIDQSERSLPG